jgi:hypothetical protein
VSPPEIDFWQELRWLEKLSNINHFSPLFANSAIYFFAVLFVEQKSSDAEVVQIYVAYC